jgi:PAS domain S-box-containing protein
MQRLSFPEWEMFEASPEMMCVVRTDGEMLYFNAAFRDRLGLSDVEVANRVFLGMRHPDDHEASLAAFASLKAVGHYPPFRNRYILSSGEHVWLEWSTVLLPDRERLFSIVRDVTAHKRDEDAISNTNLMLSAVSTALSDYVAAASTQSPFQVMLEQVLQFTGSEYGFIGEVLRAPDGAPYLKTHALTNIAWNDETRRFYDDNVEQGLEFRNLDTLFGRVMVTGEAVIANTAGTDPRRGGLPHGHPPLLAFLGLPIYSGRHLVGMIGVANRPGGYYDSIREALDLVLSVCSNLIIAFRAEKARRDTLGKLQHAEARYRTVVESVKDGIFTLDGAATITFCNPAMCLLADSTEDLLLGKTLSDVIVPDEREFVLDVMQKLVSGSSTESWFETVFCLEDGTTRHVELGLSMARGATESTLVGVVRDISTERRARHELLRAKQLAEEANKAKSDFLANMSHEIRTPLNGMIGMLELARDRPLDDQQRDYIETSLESSRNLQYLVNDLLDFARIEAGKLTIEVVQFNLRDHLEYCMQHFESAATQKGIHLTMDLDGRIPSLLLGDPQRLRQVLMNLISNAVKFTHTGGVDVQVSCIERKSDALLVQFKIRDSGIGIPDDKQAGIFNAFEQVDSSITRRYGGTGLGLSISQALVRMMGGNIMLASSSGNGSMFWFELSLPIQDGADTQHSGDQSGVSRQSLSKPEDWRPLQVLVAEDNTVNQRLFRHVLNERGHVVTMVDNGLAAVLAWQSTSFDVILMDIQMPELDGLEACRRIRAAEQAAGGTLRQRIIALTAYAMNGDRERCINAGMDEYLSKPINNIDLFRALESCFAAPAP